MQGHSNFFGPLGRFAQGWRAWREEARTRRLIEGLPSQIRKDIGWPDLWDDGRVRRSGDHRH